MSSIWDDALDGVPGEAGSAEEEPLFSPALSQDFYSLLELGKLEDTVQLGSHEIRIQTLTIGEELRVAQLIAAFVENPLASGRAYATAKVAAAITTVDGRPLAVALGPNEDLLPQKYGKVSNWYWQTVREIYDAYLTLEGRQEEIFTELSKKSDTSRDSSSPSSDSLIDKGDSGEISIESSG